MKVKKPRWTTVLEARGGIRFRTCISAMWGLCELDVDDYGQFAVTYHLPRVALSGESILGDNLYGIL